jgi:hypothetical protein
MTATNSGLPRFPTGGPRFRIDQAATAAGITRAPVNNHVGTQQVGLGKEPSSRPDRPHPPPRSGR